MEIFIGLWILCGIIGSMIGSKKGQGCLGFVLGFLLGPIGIIIEIVNKGDRRICPHCRELINKDASVCPKCQSKLKEPVLKKIMPTHEFTITKKINRDNPVIIFFLKFFGWVLVTVIILLFWFRIIRN